MTFQFCSCDFSTKARNMVFIGGENKGNLETSKLKALSSDYAIMNLDFRSDSLEMETMATSALKLRWPRTSSLRP